MGFCGPLGRLAKAPKLLMAAGSETSLPKWRGKSTGTGQFAIEDLKE